jgi:predicted alpha/beta-hydrolase family hydrolase
VSTLEIDTPHGPARAHLQDAPDARAALVLGHGAGGGVTARDLVAVSGVARSVGVSTALVEQPYRVKGRRSPAPAGQLDAAWTAVVEHLRAGPFSGLPAITGGRSSGARVACRTAEQTGAAAVLCLAFPLIPPRRSPDTPPTSREPELAAVPVPVLVVQGERDQFGMPSPAPGRAVVAVTGDHRLVSDLAAVSTAVRDWLTELLATSGYGARP